MQLCGDFGQLGSNETGNDAVPEPIETSVVALDAGMIIVQASDVPQPMDVIQPDNDSNSNSNDQPVVISSGTVESSNDVDVTPSRRKRKRYATDISYDAKSFVPLFRADNILFFQVIVTEIHFTKESAATTGQRRRRRLNMLNLLGRVGIQRRTSPRVFEMWPFIWR